MKRLLPLCFLFLGTSGAQAEDVFDIAAEYNAAKKDLNKLESQKRKVLAEIYSVEKETNKLVLQKGELDQDKLQLDRKLVEISKKIIETETKIGELIPELVERLEFADQINGLPWVYAFLTSQSLHDLDTTFETAKFINNQQSQTVVDFVELVKGLESKKAELRKTAIEIVKLKNDLKEKEKQITSNQSSKKRLLKSLEKKLASESSQMNKLKRKGQIAVQNSIFKNMSLLFGSRFFDQKGKLPSPVQASVSHEYGLNKGLLKDRIALVHKGHFYSLSNTSSVKSVAAGKVRFSGAVKGHGQVVVIDHGSRYYTTYANLKTSKIKRGTEVAQSQVIGATGFDHIQLGTGLYFEIRHFSQPQNPSDWLEKPKDHLANL